LNDHTGHPHQDEDHDEDHSHDEGHDHDHDHDHDEAPLLKDKKKKKPQMNVNIQAMFVHFFGDMLSSLLVLIVGLIFKFVDSKTKDWVQYVDPVASLLIVVIVLWTTIPLIIRCSKILLQRVPAEIEISGLRSSLLKITGIIGIHELHVWPLVDDMIIASVHISCEEGSDFNNLAAEIKTIFHTYGIHSTAIQPEFVPRNHPGEEFCQQNCVEDCSEPWCCKTSAEKGKREPPTNNEIL